MNSINKIASPVSNPDPIDIHVGLMLRARRVLLGYTQHEMADMVGISFQQVQKYERARNRISASKLYHFAKFLGVPVAYFFEGYLEDKTSLQSNEHSTKLRPSLSDIELAKQINAIENESFRKSLAGLLRAYNSEER